MKISSLTVVLSGLLLLVVVPKQSLAQHENALSGGFGLQAGMSRWSPGGFKWFNEYDRKLTKLIWLDFQFNVAGGDMDNENCWHDANGNLHCDYGVFDGNTIEFVFGVKFSWKLKKLPLIIDAKVGGALDLLLLGSDYVGIAIGARAGGSVHYFFFPNFGAGGGFYSTLAPSFITDGPGAEFYAAFDLQLISVEFLW